MNPSLGQTDSGKQDDVTSTLQENIHPSADVGRSPIMQGTSPSAMAALEYNSDQRIPSAFEPGSHNSSNSKGSGSAKGNNEQASRQSPPRNQPRDQSGHGRERVPQANTAGSSGPHPTEPTGSALFFDFAQEYLNSSPESLSKFLDPLIAEGEITSHGHAPGNFPPSQSTSPRFTTEAMDPIRTKTC